METVSFLHSFHNLIIVYLLTISIMILKQKVNSLSTNLQHEEENMAKIIAVAGKGGVGKTTVQLPEDSPVRMALVRILQNIGL